LNLTNRRCHEVSSLKPAVSVVADTTTVFAAEIP